MRWLLLFLLLLVCMVGSAMLGGALPSELTGVVSHADCNVCGP